MAENEPFIGRTLAGRFRITGYIGEGGMASVYRGVQDGDGRNVAIKVMNADLVKDRKFVRRFRREAKAASMLKHANTVEILEFGVDGDTVYLAMECIEGLDLAMVLERDRRLTEARAANVVMQVCAALSVAHAQSIIHRDLKPDNIMITTAPRGGTSRPGGVEPGAELVKVLDFGIAKILDEDEGPMPDPRAEPQSHAPSLLTRVGTIVGTPAYMSPEQGRAEKVDARTDIYACGVLLYELITGRTPFGGETPMQVVMRHVNEPPMPPSQWVDIHPELEKIILKALKKWPAERQQSAEELARALKAALPDLASAKRPLAAGAGLADGAPPTTGSAPAPMRPAAGVPSAPATQRTAPAPDKSPPAAAPGSESADDDEPSTLMIPDASVALGRNAAATPTKSAAASQADKKLVFPTLNIDLPEDLEKAGVRSGLDKSATLASSGVPSPAAKPPVATRPSPGDEDDDARTLIAHARPPTGAGPLIEISAGGGLGLAQTLASEINGAELERIASGADAQKRPLPAAGKPAATSGDEPAERGSEPEAEAPRIASTATKKDDRMALAATLPIGQLDRALLGPEGSAPRASLESLSEVSSPGLAGSSGSSPGAGSSPGLASGATALALPSTAPKRPLSVGMAMVLGALIGAIVVGGIVVALVSMR